MLFFRLGKDEYVINEDDNKLVQVLHENFVHEVHEVGRGIGQSEGHDPVLVQPITSNKCCFGDVLWSNLQLVVSRSQVNLGEYPSPV